MVMVQLTAIFFFANRSLWKKGFKTGQRVTASSSASVELLDPSSLTSTKVQGLRLSFFISLAIFLSLSPCLSFLSHLFLLSTLRSFPLFLNLSIFLNFFPILFSLSPEPILTDALMWSTIVNDESINFFHYGRSRMKPSRSFLMRCGNREKIKLSNGLQTFHSTRTLQQKNYTKHERERES